MTAERKNFDWIDTIRIFATLIVITFHYLLTLLGNDNFQAAIYKYTFGIGDWGIAAFFGISGYLVVNSLERSKSILDFYRRKIIRIVFPFTALYLAIVIFLACASTVSPKILTVLNPKLTELSIVKVVGGIFPIDVNLLQFFDVPHYFIVGEWFVGTIIWLYLIAPPVHKLLKINIPLTMLGLIAIAAATSNALTEFETQGRILSVATVFLVRLPEFATGMFLFMKREEIFKPRAVLTGIILAVAMIFYTSTLHIEAEGIWRQYFFGTTPDLHFILAVILAVYLSFVIAEFLNRHCAGLMKHFNRFKDISYTALLIQHLVIKLFAKAFDYSHISIFGAVFFFAAILAAIVLASTIIRNFYSPYENKLLQITKR